MKDLLRNIAMRYVPRMYRARLFHSIDNPTREDILNHRIEPEMLLLTQLLTRDPQAAFFDVGANAGEYLHIAAKLLPQQLLYAFEPQLEYVKKLQLLFHGAHIEPVALSSSQGVAQLKVPEIHGIPYKTRGTLETFTEKDESGNSSVTVPLETLDNYCERKAVTRISVIKIDVEGHERSVLEGARKTLERLHPTLIVEIEQRHHVDPIENIFLFIQELGYEGWFFELSRRLLAPLSSFDKALHQEMDSFKTSEYVNNFIFLPRGESVQINYPNNLLPQ